jgi:tRNA threonylcarbamoyladenosine biosynthesis protein TsaB
MAVILNIETATPLCSVALSANGELIAQRETLEEKSHAARLTIFIEEILHETKLKIADLDAISVGKGPGSYTGLRIGVSTAKGLCYGADIPLIAVNTLQILFQKIISQTKYDNKTLFCPMIDARRMEVFTCLLDHSGNEVEPVSAQIIDSESFQHYLDKNPIVFFGTGMEKCKSVISNTNAIFVSDILPHASALAILSEKYYNCLTFEDIAYFEPYYLKDFVATVSKKGLHF